MSAYGSVILLNKILKIKQDTRTLVKPYCNLVGNEMSILVLSLS